MTSRELNQRVGGFRQDMKKVFWLEDQAYIQDIIQIGYEAAVLADLVVHHTGGPHYTLLLPEKDQFWADYWGVASSVLPSRGSSSRCRSSPV